MGLFKGIKKALGLKNKYAKKEIKEGGKLRGAVLLSEKERGTMTKAERLERFKKWMEEQEI